MAAFLAGAHRLL